MAERFRAFVEIEDGVERGWGVVWPFGGGFTMRIRDPGSDGFIEARGLEVALPHERLRWLDEELARVEAERDRAVARVRELEAHSPRYISMIDCPCCGYQEGLP